MTCRRSDCCSNSDGGGGTSGVAPSPPDVYYQGMSDFEAHVQIAGHTISVVPGGVRITKWADGPDPESLLTAEDKLFLIYQAARLASGGGK